jgi:hypothetical protein
VWRIVKSARSLPYEHARSKGKVIGRLNGVAIERGPGNGGAKLVPNWDENGRSVLLRVRPKLELLPAWRIRVIRLDPLIGALNRRVQKRAHKPGLVTRGLREDCSDARKVTREEGN